MRFADTAYFLALLNTRDQWHGRASVFSRRDEQTITTTWVMMELGNMMSAPPARRVFVNFMHSLAEADFLEIIPADEGWFTRGFELYRRRPDKAWSLTDCISFLVMQDRGIDEALTSDHHFTQAGFQVLLQD